MKKIVALLVALSLCIVFCACGGDNTNTIQQQPTQTQKPVKYEDTLIEKVKIGDSLSTVEEVFGKATSSEEENSKYTYKFEDVSIYSQKFTPTVYIKNDKVIQYEYRLRTNNHAKIEAVYAELIENFTTLYGTPNESSSDRCMWYFLDGRTLHVAKGFFVTNFVAVIYY